MLPYYVLYTAVFGSVILLSSRFNESRVDLCRDKGLILTGPTEHTVSMQSLAPCAAIFGALHDNKEQFLGRWSINMLHGAFLSAFLLFKEFVVRKIWASFLRRF